MSPDAQDRLIEARLKYPDMQATVLVGHMVEAGELEAGTFSMASVYRLFAVRGVDRSSLKAGSFQPGSGPQKAFCRVHVTRDFHLTTDETHRSHWNHGDRL